MAEATTVCGNEWDQIVQRLQSGEVTQQFIDRIMENPKRASIALNELSQMGFVKETPTGWEVVSEI